MSKISKNEIEKTESKMFEHLKNKVLNKISRMSEDEQKEYLSELEYEKYGLDIELDFEDEVMFNVLKYYLNEPVLGEGKNIKMIDGYELSEEEDNELSEEEFFSIYGVTKEISKYQGMTKKEYEDEFLDY